MFARRFEKSNEKSSAREGGIFFISMRISSKRKKNKKNRIEGELYSIYLEREAFYASRQSAF
jgi:hypothetical protein